MKTSKISGWALVLGFGLIGCSADVGSGHGEGQTAVELPQAEMESVMVATIELPEARVVEIYETGEAGFSYVQSGPYGTVPVVLPDSLHEDGDPVKVFEALAPDEPVPIELTRAVDRAVEFLRAHDTDATRAADNTTFDTSTLEMEASEIADDVLTQPGLDDHLLDSTIGQTQQALSDRDINAAGWTGFGGCPEWWFNQASVNGQLFCPNQGKHACYKWVNWAFFSDPNAWNGYGAVCSDWGTAIFQTTVNQTVDTFWVAAGSWRFVQYAGLKTCGWFSCSPARSFQKFDLVNTSAVAHLGARTF